MKRIILITLLLGSTVASFAQSNFYQFAIGGGAGVTQSFTEVPKHATGIAGYGTIDYLFTPFTSLGLEFQKGEINGGNVQTDPLNRQFINSYQSFSINGKVSMGEFMQDHYRGSNNWIRGIYVGAGIGVIKNSPVYTVHSVEDPDYVYSMQASSSEVYFPLNIGINFFFPDHEGFYRYVLNVNYQGNLTLGEGLDGYDDSKVTFQGGKPDIYTYFSVGVKYNLGRMGLSKKTFRQY
ncbi:hypothetical protein [Pedobacter sp. L105]|uniref:hypothetical protein n=1 Tax=Pedobacter sp. L105 TaxID=1641871 RepID=UPI0020B14321|nr:hypothetical protein [Pedobacter sp. L105]